MRQPEVVVLGGGAAGFFAAIACAETAPGTAVRLLEKAPRFLAKVRISGGGRCNVTNACFAPSELSAHYPRGGRSLIGPFQVFQPRDTIEWFAARGVKLKTEPDGRMFPTTDSSQTIIDCLMDSARRAGVELVANQAPVAVTRGAGSGFELILQRGEKLFCKRLLLATGGCRAAAAGQIAVSLGHTLEPPVPSLFTFHVAAPWLHALAGISVTDAELSAPAARLRERGAVLLTHAGLSGPAVLKLSAWGARLLHNLGYNFALRVNWLPSFDEAALIREFEEQRRKQPARFVVNTAFAARPNAPPLAGRLWESIIIEAGIARQTRWAELSRSARHRLIQQLSRTELQVNGKTLNQDEFVTCGGVRLSEVDFKTMESRICPGLYLAGELLDIDGLTGGFNFQSAWTTGWIAGRSMAR